MQALDRAQWALAHILLSVCLGLKQPESFNIYSVVHNSVWKVSPVKVMKAHKLFWGRKHGLKLEQLGQTSVFHPAEFRIHHSPLGS